MTYGSRIKLLLFAFCVILSACQALPQPTTKASPSVEVDAPQELAKALCEAWLGSLATWADEDSEQTKDAVDLSIRKQEAVCSPF